MNIGGWKNCKQYYNKTFLWEKATFTLLLGVFDLANESSGNSAFLEKMSFEN